MNAATHRTGAVHVATASRLGIEDYRAAVADFEASADQASEVGSVARIMAVAVEGTSARARSEAATWLFMNRRVVVRDLHEREVSIPLRICRAERANEKAERQKRAADRRADKLAMRLATSDGSHV